MNQQQLLFLVVVGAGAALLGVLTAPLLAPDAEPEPEPAAPASSAEGAPGTAPAPAPAGGDGPQITRTTSIPKPERRPRPADGAHLTRAGAAAPDPSDADAAGGEADDTGAAFGQVDPTREFSPDEIQATVATFKGDIEACLDDWGPQIDGFDGRLVLQADFSPEGVEDVRIADLDNVPLQLLGCFSTPVWEATWPQPDGAVTISYPFVIEVPDQAGEE